MGNASGNEMRQWVAEQTALLDPPANWEPDSERGRRRFEARRMQASRAEWRGWAVVAAAAAAAAVLILLVPGWRAAADELWQSLTVRHVAFVTVKPWPEGVPSPWIKLMGRPIPPIPARDLEDARWRVHYDPRLPHPGVLTDSPKLSTTFGVSAETAISVADLEEALRASGVTDLVVPAQWDGARLTLHTSGVVIAEWPDAVLVQSLPLTLTMPPGFDFPSFSALILRVMGVGPDEARRLAQQAGTVPPWIAPVTKGMESHGTIEDIRLNSGPGTLLTETSEGRVTRLTLVWSVPDRIYGLQGTLNRELAIAVANAVQ
jgi:hypothetical protein